MRRFIYYNSSYVSGCTDADVLAFLSATGIVDATISSALCTLVTDLKSNGLWSKMKYIYPFVGGTATTNKFNLKDPQDLDASFRLTFIGGVTHTNGFNPNGLNGYADTHCIPSTNVTLNNEHLCIVSNTNNVPSTPDSVDCGAFDAVSNASLLAIVGTASKNIFQSRMNGDLVITPNANATGVYVASKVSTTTLSIYKNGSLSNSGASIGSLSTRNIFLGTLNLGSPYGSGYTNQNYTFASYGDGLSSSEVSTLTSIINTFNTALSR